MRYILLTALLALFLISCESTLDNDCDISTLNMKGKATINGEEFCYNDGSLVHDMNNNLIILTLRNNGNNENSFVVRFSVSAQGLNFNNTLYSRSWNF